MLFISFEYAFFLVFVILATALLEQRSLQIILLLLASYFFYITTSGFLIVALLFATGITFFCGERIQRARETKKKKVYLFLALIATLGQLSLFKYFGLSLGISNLMHFPANFGMPMDGTNLLLPLGISFFTFQSLSYVFDIYRGKLTPASSFKDYALFVSFFPQITSGPIVRAKDFLSQLQAKVRLDIESQSLKNGITLIGIGLVKKMVIADNIASYADTVFSHPTYFGSLRIILATVAFGIQLYCDFSGYSDIAIGIARILGFRYPINFNNPYLAFSPNDFWHRWNISLSSFLRDYLYIPLGGNRKGESEPIQIS
jgi:alginate O-acetyltransferase complex protein AlgI